MSQNNFNWSFFISPRIYQFNSQGETSSKAWQHISLSYKTIHFNLSFVLFVFVSLFYLRNKPKSNTNVH